MPANSFTLKTFVYAKAFGGFWWPAVALFRAHDITGEPIVDTKTLIELCEPKPSE